MSEKAIKAIDKGSVHRICSGQVVVSLAIAVKELVENSLDAGATRVDIRLKEYGSDLVEVSDNGSGVHPDNFQALTLKHHTSKLSDFSDLAGVATFGFRGEALSSLCALGKVSVTTRHSSQSVGTTMIFDNAGHIETSSAVPRQVGTTVSIENLFSTLPVRRKEFLRNVKKEFTKMTQLLNAYCLVSTKVKITCVNQTGKGSKTTFIATQGCDSVKENISCIFGSKLLPSLIEVELVEPSLEELESIGLKEHLNGLCLEGFISTVKHGSGRSSADRQFFYINSRPCEPAKVSKAVNEIYHQYNPHQYPFVYLNIKVSRDTVDVNVTPDKRQVFMDQEKYLVAAVKSSLHALYKSVPSTYSVNQPKEMVLSQHSPKSVGTFLQFRHKSDFKRELSSDDMRQAKQRKLAEHFGFTKTKYETTASTSYFSENDKICPEEENVSTTVEVFTSKSEINYEIHVEQNIKEDTKCNSSVSISTIEKTSKVIKYLDSGQIEKKDLLEVKLNNCPLEMRVEENCYSIHLDHCLEKEELVSGKRSQSVSEKQSQSSESEEQSQPSGAEGSKGPSQSSGPEGQSQSSGSYASLPLEVQLEIESDGELLSGPSGDGSRNVLDNPPSVIRTDQDMPEKTKQKVVFSSIDIELLRKEIAERRKKKLENVEKEVDIKFMAVIDPSKNSQAEAELDKAISKDMFKKMEIIGQFNLGFIITKLNDDLFIIDQHATDEKYNFETLQATTTLSNQKLVIPQILDLTAANECVLLDNMDIFKKNGFDFIIDQSASCGKKVKLSAIPMSKNWVFGKEDVDELLFMLEDSPGTMCRPSRVRAMFASRACRSSVMIGDPLGIKEMRRLVDHMAEIEQPWNCPHGRPTMRHLVNLNLLKQDERTDFI